MNAVAIYALCEPISGAVRYVGYSKDAPTRYKGHLSENSKTHKSRWVNKLLREGAAPKLRVLCVVQGATEAKRVEVALIAAYRRRGARLTNSTAGGDGVVDPSPEARAKISATHRGRIQSAEEIEKRRLGQLRYHSKHPNAAKVNSAVNLGKKHTAEARAKMSAALLGRPHEEERKKKISDSLRSYFKTHKPHNAGVAGDKCKPGCDCFRHQDTGRKCLPGCTCGRHDPAMRAARSSAPTGTTPWNKGKRYKIRGCIEGCTCGRHRKRGAE